MAEKTVWILGAGFSRPLGGPLLCDLFSSASRALILETYSNVLERNRVIDVTNVYHTLRKGPNDKYDDQKLWDHAEHFLSLLDRVARKEDGEPEVRFLLNAIEKRFRIVNSQSLRDALLIALQCLAAECSAFVRLSNPKDSEEWRPYISWAERMREMGTSHTVITFNYDLVLETLDRLLEGQVFTFVLPGQFKEPQDTVNVLKLHGSVNWKVNKSAQCVEVGEEDAAIRCTDLDCIGIASPGTAKLQRTTGPFCELWTRASQAIIEADRIIVIGYRAPETDVQALELLVGALAKNFNRSVRAEVILGPMVNGHDTVRICQLVAHGLKGSYYRRPSFPKIDSNDIKIPHREVLPLPFWSQDFLTTYSHCVDVVC